MPAMTEPPHPGRKYARQKRLVAILGCLLIVAGIIVLFALERVPLPMRMMAGLGDVFIGCVLLVLVRQQQ
jgi:hypothetical protein